VNEAIKVSVVGPVYRGVGTISSFITQTKEALVNCGEAFEIILVDDGCPKGSWESIENECRKDPAIKGIRLSRNFGQQIAISAGLHFAKGERVIVMDTDLQNPPDVIPVILEKLGAGADVVYTISKVRNNWIDEATSALFWFLVNKVLGVHMVPNQL